MIVQALPAFFLSLILMFQSGQGVITGRLVSKNGKPIVGATVQVFTAPAGAGGHVPSVKTDSDGRYQIEKIPVGRYYVSTGPNNIHTYYPGSLERASAEIVEVQPGQTAKVADFSPASRSAGSRVVVEGKGPSPRLALQLTNTAGRVLTVEQKRSSLSSNKYETTLPQGEWKVALDSTVPLPVGYVLKSLRYGDQDLLRGPLKVVPTDSAELIATFTAPRGSAVKVTGRVTGLDLRTRSYEFVIDAGVVPVSLRAKVKSNGSFEFPQVTQGKHTLNLLGAGGIPLAYPIVVVDRDIQNLEIAALPQKEIAGQVRVDGFAMGAIILRFQLRQGSETFQVTTVTSSSGSFKLALPLGETPVTLLGVAPGDIKEFKYGSLDLLNAPLQILAGDSGKLSLWLASGARTGSWKNSVRAPVDLSETAADVTIKPPMLLRGMAPPFSEIARKTAVDGRVAVEGVILENGSVEISRVIRSLGNGLDEQAIAAAEQWRFQPGTRNGVPFASKVTIEVEFR